MPPPGPPLSIHSLLPHAAFVRRLARSLADDRASADDLEQDAWLRAMTTPPRAAGAVRSWFRRVMGNRRAELRRAHGRLTRRERAVARPEADPAGPDDVVRRAEEQRALVAAVLELEEPSRTTVLLRYLDGLSVAEVAARTGASEAAVRQRTHRGLERLREVLDARHRGDRRAWAALLCVPLPSLAAAPAAPISGALLMAAPARAVVLAVAAALALAAIGVGGYALLGPAADHGDAPRESATGTGDDPAAAGAASLSGRAAPTTAVPAPHERALPPLPKGTARVAGEVRLRAGNAPAVGAVVTAAREGFEPRRATVSASGAFALGDLPAGGPLEVTASKDPLAPARRAGLRLLDGERRDLGVLRLDAAARARVRVVGPRGEPVAKASVEAFPEREGVAPEDWAGVPVPAAGAKETDAAGDAVFDDLAVGGWLFRGRAAGLAPGVARVAIARGGGETRVTVALAKGYPLAGRVTGTDGAAVAGATVLLLTPREATEAFEPKSDGPAPAGVATGADGRYAFDAVPAGDWSIAVKPAGGLAARVAVIEVPSISTYDVRLDGGAMVGRVTSEDGAPLEGAVVQAAVWRRHHPTYLRATTGADGRYRMDVPLGGIVNGPARGDGEAEAKGIHLTVTKPGWTRVPVADATLWSNPWVLGGAVTTYDVVMRRAATVKGRVLGPDGAPVARAEVTAEVWNDFSGLSRATTTGDDAGAFAFEGLPEGRARLLASKDGMLSTPAPGGGWRESPGPSPEAVFRIPRQGEVARDVTLAKGAALAGRVTSPAGAPVEGARVTARAAGDPEASAVTDADGRFALAGLRAGATASVRASAAGFASKEVSVAVPAAGDATPVELALRPRGAVRGRVVVSGGGEVPAGAFVQVAEASAVLDERYEVVSVWGRAPRASVGADGRFAAEAPEGEEGKPLRVVVRAAAPGLAPAASEALEVPTPGALEGVTLTLAPGFALTGRVVDAEGEPVAGAAVECANSKLPPALANGRDWSSTGIAMHPFEIVATAGRDGRFEVGDLPAWEYELRVSAPDHGWGQAVAKVPGGGEVVVTLPKDRAISGRVHYADGSPVANAVVLALPAAGGPPQGQSLSDADGRFHVDGLDAGSFVLEARSPGTLAVDLKPSRSAPVESGTAAVVDVVAVRGAAPISGRCVGPGGRPVPGASLSLKPATGGPVQSARSDAEGGFTVLGLTEGVTYVLTGTATRTLGGPESFGLSLVVEAGGLTPGRRDVVLDFRPALSIRGRVVRVDGKPLPADAVLRVRGAPAGAWTRFVPLDGDGRFEARNLPAGAYDLSFFDGPSAPDAKPAASARADAGATDVLLTIP